MSEFLLLRPFWLLALLPILALAYWLRYRRATGPWAAIIDPALAPALRQLGMLVDGTGSRLGLLPLLAAAVLAIALSGPAMLRPGATEFRAFDPLVLVLDLSPSVVADARVLGELQVSAASILAASAGRPVGMMLYAADAYLASAPTTDASALQGLVAVLEQGTVPVAGSRPDIALSAARDLFSAAAGAESIGIGGTDLVVISDGGGIGARAVEEAARLKSDGARVWGLVIAANAAGAPAPDAKGMAELAAAGGGAALASGEVEALMQQITRARTARLTRQEVGDHSFHDFGPWLLPLALLALLPLFRRRQ